MNSSVAAYLSGLDAHLATVADPFAKRMALKDERERVERIEQALATWAASPSKKSPPSRFSAFDLAILDGELVMRLQALSKEAVA